MADLSSYFAAKTCAEIRKAVGFAEADFGGKLFHCNSQRGNEFPVWGECRMRIEDGGEVVHVLVSGYKNIGALAEKVGKLEIARKYKSVAISARLYEDGGELVGEIRFREKANTEGRTQNEDRLFYALHNVVTKPLLRAIYEICSAAI